MQFRLGVGVLWAVCLGFAIGIFLRSLIEISDTVILSLGFAALISLSACVIHSKILRIALVLSAMFIAIGGGIMRMESAILKTDPFLEEKIGSRIVIEGTIDDEPDVRATQVRVPLRVQYSGIRVLAVFPAHTEIYYGEYVRVSGNLEKPKSFETGLGRQFNYPGYLAAQGISYQLDRITLEEGSDFKGNPIIALSYRAKEFFIAGLQRSLPEPQSGLAGGITVGDKRAMGKDLMAEFQATSLLHVVVLSGYNITVVIGALFGILARAPRAVRFGAGGVVALFFAVMTGFASASLRAALMAMISISGTLSGRIYRADRALILVAFIMLIWNPYLLVFDPGFQLSFLACAGLLVFSPIFSGWTSRLPEFFGIKEIFNTTASAQIAVLPLLLYQSGLLSFISIPANLLALIAIPLAMFFSSFAAIGGIIAEPIAPILALPANLLLSYVLAVVHVFASIPFSTITIPAFSPWILIVAYTGIFGFGFLQNARKDKAAAL
jgi:competence protein ComEC